MKLRLRLLKRKFRGQYMDYMHSSSHFDCGGCLAAYISPDINIAKRKLAKTYHKLRGIDPTCPAIEWLEDIK